MKKLRIKEIQQSLLGFLLVGGLILMYCLLMSGVEGIKFFRYFLPGFWLLYSVVVLVSLFLQRDVSLYEGMSNEAIQCFTNYATVVVMIAGYFTSILKGMSVTYYAYQPVYFTVVVCVLVAVNIVCVTSVRVRRKKEDKVVVEVKSSTDAKEIGVNSKEDSKEISANNNVDAIETTESTTE